MNCKAIYLSSILIMNCLSANALTICGKAIQGEMLIGKDASAQKVFFKSNQLPLTQDGQFGIAISRDEKKEIHLVTVDKEKEKHDYYLFVKPTKWDIQKVDGVPQKTVNPSGENLAKIQKENDDLNRALSIQSDFNFWHNGFINPIKGGRISGEFGGQRIINGEPKSYHRGIDIAAPEGTEIFAANDGVVRLSGGNYFYSGNMVVIDHGHNLFTIYAHMKTTKVKEGQQVKQGEIIGTVGKTGRATGPHLHYGVSLNNVRFNPASLQNMNKDSLCFDL